MKKRILSLILAVFMMLSCFSAMVSAESLKNITSVSVFGFSVPIIGEFPYNYISYGEDDPFEAADYAWYCFNEKTGKYEPMSEEIEFSGSGKYKYYVELSPKSGYEFSADNLPEISINGVADADIADIGVRDNGNLYFWTSESAASVGVNIEIYLDADDEYSTSGFSLPKGACLGYEAPARENEIFEGWYYDKECTEKYISDTPIYKDTAFYAKWISSDEAVIDEVEVWLEYYPPSAGKTSEYCGYCGVDYYARYEVTDSYWYCDYMDGKAYNKPLEAEDIFSLEGKYSFNFSLEPKDGYTFDDNTTITVKNNDGDEITVDTDNSYISCDMIDVWTVITSPMERVTFCNSYGEVSFEVEKGTVVGEITAPGREGYTFDGWYTDEQLQTPYDPTKPIMVDTTIYPKWINEEETEKIIIDEVDITLEYYPPTLGKTADYCSSCTTFYGANYDITNSVWNCDYIDGEVYSEFMDGNEIFTSNGEYSFFVRLEPQYGYIFDDNVAISVTDSNGDIVPLDEEYLTVSGDEIDIWTAITSPVERVQFFNSWGKVCFEVKKGTVVGNVAEPGREGYTFAGWYTDEQLQTPYNPNMPITVDTVIYPKWISETNNNELVLGVSAEIAAPETGKTAAYEVKLPQNAHYSIFGNSNDNDFANGVGWYNVTDDKWLNPQNAVFESGKEYRVYITLQVNEGYEFDLDESNFTAAVNDQMAKWEARHTTARIITVNYTFEALEYIQPELKKISAVSLNIEQPQDGSVPSYKLEIPDNANYTMRDETEDYYINGIAWYNATDYRWLTPNVSKFEAGKEYKAYIYVVPKQGYVFDCDDNITVTVNGEAVNASSSEQVLEIVYITSVAAPTYSVSGTVQSFGSESEEIMITLCQGEDEIYETTVTGNNTTYLINEVEAGTYTLKVSKIKHAPREYTVVVDNTNVVKDVKILLYGNLSGSGEVDNKDATQIKRYFNSLSNVIESTTDESEKAYLFKVADVNSDGEIDNKDATQIKRYFNNLSSVFDSLD